MPEPASLASKRQHLEEILRASGRVLVAYSGGVDSAYLAWVAHQQLGGNMLAIVADSPSLARTQLADAVAFARESPMPDPSEVYDYLFSNPIHYPPEPAP